ncbi:hypothetical protein VE03_10413, partial [Pseudogymnoascus sp. 23342-1-I1]
MPSTIGVGKTLTTEVLSEHPQKPPDSDLHIAKPIDGHPPIRLPGLAIGKISQWYLRAQTKDELRLQSCKQMWAACKGTMVQHHANVNHACRKTKAMPVLRESIQECASCCVVGLTALTDDTRDGAEEDEEVQAKAELGAGISQTDNDSALGSDDTGSSTTSLESYVTAYRQENGRTYHSFQEGGEQAPTMIPSWVLTTRPYKVYAIPNDKLEQDRLADEFPEAQVTGIDLSPIQPKFVPPNLKFVVDDIEDEWVFGEKFDLVHLRMMAGSFLDWPQFFTRAYNQLHPGGYIELQDAIGLACDDETFTSDPPCPLAEWWALVTQAFAKTGRDIDAASQHKERLENAGFVHVTVVDFQWPINMWPEDPHLRNIGMWSKENTLDALEALAMAPLTRTLEWKPEDVQELLLRARTDVENQGIHAYWK